MLWLLCPSAFLTFLPEQDQAYSPDSIAITLQFFSYFPQNCKFHHLMVASEKFAVSFHMSNKFFLLSE